MIIMVKDSEIKEMLKSLNEIEEQFWINYKNFRMSDRRYIEDQMLHIRKKFDDLVDMQGTQETFLND